MPYAQTREKQGRIQGRSKGGNVHMDESPARFTGVPMRRPIPLPYMDEMEGDMT
jgi:hypothetical protein